MKAAGDGEVVFGEEYRATRLRVFRVNLLGNVLILLTIYFMTTHTG